jgi:integrase
MAKGIYTKTLNDGTKAIYVRFKYLGKTYPVKNFTKIFNCRTEKQAYNKLQEIKVDIRNGNNPFNPQGKTLNDYWQRRFDKMVKSGEWRDNTQKIYKVYYDKFIKKDIGHLKLDKIKIDHLENIHEKTSGKSAIYQNRLKLILNPIFQKALVRGEIRVNPLDSIKSLKVDKKPKLTTRSLDNHLEIAKKLYKAIDSYKAQYIHQREEIKNFLHLMLLSGHRYGELIELTKEDIYLEHNLIVSPEAITKTKEDYHFPIPSEVLEYINGIEEGKLFPTISYGSVYMIFQRLVKIAKITLIKGKKLSPHDTRTIMMNSMIKLGLDSRLADFCLEHKQPEVLEHYLDFEYEDKVRAFNIYWEAIKS